MLVGDVAAQGSCRCTADPEVVFVVGYGYGLGEYLGTMAGREEGEIGEVQVI